MVKVLPLLIFLDPSSSFGKRKFDSEELICCPPFQKANSTIDWNFGSQSGELIELIDR